MTRGVSAPTSLAAGPAAPHRPFIPRLAAGATGLAETVAPHATGERPGRRASNIRALTGSRTARTYRIHAYWSKKPHEVLRECLEKLTEPGDLVLDPFCGSGGTLLMATMLGRRAVGIDRSPAAAFISLESLRLPPGDAVRAAYAALRTRVEPEIRELYATRCHRCGGTATLQYSVIADEINCESCGGDFTAETAVKCRNKRRCPRCGHDLPRTPHRQGWRLVEVAAICEAGCRPARIRRRHDDANVRSRLYFRRYDVAKLAEIERAPLNHWYPAYSFPSGLKTAELFGRGIHTVDKLFTRRNLRALAVIRAAIDEFDPPERSLLLLCLTGGLTSLSLKAQHLEGGGGYLPGMYYIPPVRKERNALVSLGRIAQQVARGADELHSSAKIQPPAWVGIGSAEDLRGIPDGSVDFVFLDPPYSDKIQFWELNFVWESWLDVVEEWGGEEIVLNRVRGKSLAEWSARMERVAREAFRVLRSGGRAVLTYDDPRHGTRPLLLEVLRGAGFEIDAAPTFFTTRQKTFVQRRSPRASTRDPLAVLSKP